MKSIGTLHPITVDSASTRLHDDAIMVETDDGGHVVHVAFPRVQDRCPLGSREDARAAASFASDGGLPMYSRPVARSLSLLPGQARDAFVATVRVDAGANVREVGFGRTRVVSAARLDHPSAARALADRKDRNHATLVHGAKVAFRRRAMRGVGGNVGPSEIVEEAIRLANFALARMCSDMGVPLLYVDADKGQAKPRLSLEPVGVPFAWFNAPIRRYVDVVNQRLLEDALDGNVPRYPPEALVRLVDDLHAADRERRLGVTNHAGRAKATEEAKALLAAGPGALPTASDTAFMMAVRLTLATGVQRADVVEEAERRHDDGRLRADSLLRLALVEEGWKGRLLATLTEDRSRARRSVGDLLMAARDKLDWSLTWGGDAAGYVVTLDEVRYDASAEETMDAKVAAATALFEAVLSGRHSPGRVLGRPLDSRGPAS